MAHSVFIDGAAGTTGLEILDRLQGRGEFELIRLDETLRKSTDARRDALNAADIAILCLPDEAAREAMAMLDPAGKTRVIDASSAHRTTEGWCYGFPELVGRERVAEARRVSNPGCYPAGFLALLAPLVRAGLLPADWPYTVHGVSGYSGGGKALIERFEQGRTRQGTGAPAYRAYALGMGHKHLAEMQKHAALDHAPLFAPAVIDAYRGMMVEVALPLQAMGQMTGQTMDQTMGGAIGMPSAMRDCLEEAYHGSPIVKLPLGPREEIVLTAVAEPWDGMDLFVHANEDGTQARLIARFDNLGKGASGAAIQNLNLMCGCSETAGLRLPTAQ